jgi:cytochrome bd-type quinol oxidase subunit 1
VGGDEGRGVRPAHFYAGAVTAALLPLVYIVVWKVLTGNFSPEVQSMVIGAVVSGVLSAITGFWLGSSASSQRKDQAAEMGP